MVLGPSFIRCPPGHRSLTIVALNVHLTILHKILTEIFTSDNCGCYPRIRHSKDNVKLQEGVGRFRVFAKVFGHEIPTRQMHYNADYKEFGQENQCLPSRCTRKDHTLAFQTPYWN